MSDDQDKEMDKKREKIANNIIRKMVDSNAPKSDIKQQQKTNKETLGHEGDVE